ncbi:MAG: lactate utilization protein, partial [Christensenella sp.]|uniref:lactate utilization protein n=1 Tax=Christensenella sp. TaxID=1935934 RepID=UPI002B1FE45D
MSQYDELIGLLNKKGFHAAFFEDAASAKEEVLKLLSRAQSVGIGGSMTLNETGIFDAVTGSGKEIYSQVLERQKENPDVKTVWQNAMTADAYLTSTNALTQQGDLINIDGNGNRVAAMFFGPEQVIVVCGVN